MGKAELLEQLSDIALVIVDAEFLGDDALEVGPPPAHDAVDLAVGPRLDDRGKLSQLLGRQTRLRAVQWSKRPSGPAALKRWTQSRKVWRSMPPIRDPSRRGPPPMTKAAGSG